jgi:hypothetical protein
MTGPMARGSDPFRVVDPGARFAYHKEDTRTIIGFYFQSDVGSSSAAYEVLSEKTKAAFQEHFHSITTGPKADWILDFGGAHGKKPNFNQELFTKLCDFLEKRLGPDADERTGWKPTLVAGPTKE